MRVKEETEKAGLKLSIKNLRSWHLVPSVHGKQKEKMWKQWQISSSWALKSVQIVPAAMKLEDGCFLAGKLCQCVKKQRYPFADKGHYSQGYGLYSSHIWTWELDHKEGWRIDAFKLWCWRRLLRVPWRARRSNQSIFFFFSNQSILNQPSVIIGRTDAEAPILWPPDVNSQLIGKKPWC